jgi:hypothetical protein
MSNQANAPKLSWIDLREIGVEGRGWADTAHPFDRLPARAQKDLDPDLWTLSQHSAGMSCRFVTDSTQIFVRWALRHPLRTDPSMSRLSEAGFDLYVRRGKGYDLIGVCGTQDVAQTTQHLASALPPESHECLIHLPLYNGPDVVEIGIDPGSSLKPIAPRSPTDHRPIVFYGTSITQGAFASRSGMAYPSILSRRLDRPIINLGFAGMGRMEPAMANLLAELPAGVFVIDPVPNLTAEQVAERTRPFIRTIRKAHPQTRIIMVESLIRSLSHYQPAWRERVPQSNAQVRAAYVDLCRDDSNLKYVEGSRLVGEDGEMTVEGTHPTDWGFAHIADVLAPLL